MLMMTGASESIPAIDSVVRKLPSFQITKRLILKKQSQISIAFFEMKQHFENRFISFILTMSQEQTNVNVVKRRTDHSQKI